LKQSHHLNITVSKVKVSQFGQFHHFNIFTKSYTFTLIFHARLVKNVLGKLSIIFSFNFASSIISKASFPFSGVATSIDQTIGVTQSDDTTKLAILLTD
jgi:hypothetical protein